jgi:ATP-dependent DNA ligase
MWVNGRRRCLTAEHAVTLFVFDVLRHDGVDLCGEPRTTRRAILDQFDLATATSEVVQTASYTGDGEAMHQATLAIRAEGTVSKKESSVYDGHGDRLVAVANGDPGGPVAHQRAEGSGVPGPVPGGV